MITNKPHIIYIKKPNFELSGLMKLHYGAIPPLNTDISFDLPYYKFEPNFKLSEMPTNFNWKDPFKTDTEEITQKKKLIHPVMNQELCGSCYAVSSATTISDVFVVSGIVDYFPDISTGYALSCLGQNKCNGGNPGTLLKNIVSKGISDKSCINYDWCTQNPICTGENGGIFNVTDLNKLVPSCECKNKPYKLYFIDNPSVSSITLNRELYISVMKNHILKIGPCIGGFIVEKNFIDGRFTNPNINNGVYLDNAIYDDDTLKFQDDNYKHTHFGGHAVSVIGWGVAKDTVVDKYGNVDDVQYWYCRNSWGKNWGYDDGYFKMAMFPWNKYSQFDVIIDEKFGGMILFTASKPPKIIDNIKEEFINSHQKNISISLCMFIILIFFIIIGIIIILLIK